MEIRIEGGRYQAILQGENIRKAEAKAQWWVEQKKLQLGINIFPHHSQAESERRMTAGKELKVYQTMGTCLCFTAAGCSRAAE